MGIEENIWKENNIWKGIMVKNLVGKWVYIRFVGDRFEFVCISLKIYGWRY